MDLIPILTPTALCQLNTLELLKCDCKFHKVNGKPIKKTNYDLGKQKS